MSKTAYLLFWFILLPCFCLAQNSKKVKALQQQKTELQKKLDKSKAQLQKTQHEVQTGQRDLSFLDMQLDSRLEYIRELEGDMNQLDTRIASLQVDIAEIDKELKIKREKYKQALRYARQQREHSSTLLFVLSAKTLTQMYRRARYARKYVRYQRDLGTQIMQKQSEMFEVQNELLQSKSQMNSLLREVMTQRKEINIQQIQQREKVTVLKKQETGLVSQVQKQQKQLTNLNKKIDELIAYEIEQARKRAEEEARKKAAAQAAKNKKSSSKSSSTKTSTTTKTKSTTNTSTQSWLTSEDLKLNGSFAQNKGRLPVPITGQYMLGNRYGVYNVPGLKDVKLDNKGTNFIGKTGAKARSVFDGVVSAVFQFAGTKNVLVRHGSYISVYCNLSSVSVAKGQKVKARDILGSIANDGNGNFVLHFQLRKETTKLNPEAWIAR